MWCVSPSGVPGVKPERMTEGMHAQHCALSLVGEPIMYPEINRLVKLLHQKKISTFLVTNAQFPEAIRYSAYVCYVHMSVLIESVLSQYSLTLMYICTGRNIQ